MPGNAHKMPRPSAHTPSKKTVIGKHNPTKRAKQADGVTGYPQVTRAGVKCARKESANLSFVSCRFREKRGADGKVDKSRVRVILLQEGLGNLKDAYYYTDKALRSAVPIFEGKKIYANHPAASEDEERPERDVRDVLGHYENVGVATVEGRQVLEADCVTVKGDSRRWTREMLAHAVEYAKKYRDQEFVGLSINAGGESEAMDFDEFLRQTSVPDAAMPKLREAQAEGVTTINRVDRITSAVSCDLVTEAGAGGKVLDMIEQEKKLMAKKIKKVSKGAREAARSAIEETVEGREDELVEGDIHVHAEPTDHAEPDGDEDDDAEESETEEAETETEESETESEESETETEESEGDDDSDAMARAKNKFGKEKKKEGQTPPPNPKATKEANVVKKPKSLKEALGVISTLQKSVIKLTGVVSGLTESVQKTHLDRYLDKKLAKTGLSREATKRFRKLMPVLESEKSIDEHIALFVEGAKLGGGPGRESFVVAAEKGNTAFTESRGPAKLDLSDCVPNYGE